MFITDSEMLSIQLAFNQSLLPEHIYISLQKQVCYFDHRVVTVVAVKLWL